MADFFDWSSTAASNTTVDGIGIDTNMSISDIDNALRTIMAAARSTFSGNLETFLSGASPLAVAYGGTGAATLTGILKGNGTSAVSAITIPTDTNSVKFLRTDSTFAAPLESFILKVTDDATALATGTGKAYFDMPYDFTVTAVKAALATAQTSGSIVTVDININGSTMLSTKLTVDNTETSSSTAATAAVISSASVSADNRITVDIDQIGDGTAEGLTVTLIGRQA